MSDRFLSIIALLLLNILVCFGQSGVVLPPPPEPEENNVYYLYGNDGWGNVPKGWKQQQKLLQGTSDSDLEVMALNSKTPAHRAMAFDSLASKHSERCYDILLQELGDNDRFRPGLNHLNKYTSVSRLKGMDGLYDRMRDLYLKGDSYLLPLIAEYKNQDDIPMIIKALREYKKGLDRQGACSNKPEGNTNYALDALMIWRVDAFMPVLEELRNYELSRKYIDYYRVKMLFKVVMAYDNDWAYHFIEDTFENKGGKNKYSYPDNL